MKTKKILKKAKVSEAQGQKKVGKQKLAASIGVAPRSKPSVISQQVTSYSIFTFCVKRAKNLVDIHESLHGVRAKPPKPLSDTHRAAIVLAISALDAFIRAYLISGIRKLLANKKAVLPPPLSEKIRKSLKDDVLLEAARKDDLLERVEKAFEGEFKKKSFQGTKNIEESMQLLGYEDIFRDVAIKAGMNEETLRKDLNKYTERRHIIAHSGDYDLTQSPPKENTIKKMDANGCIKLVIKIARGINELGEEE